VSRGQSPQKPGFWQRVGQFIENDRKKWGGMALGAHARLGMAEIRELGNPAAGSVAQPTPLGMYGTATPGEVGAAREQQPEGPVRRMEEEPSHASPTPRSPSAIAEGKGGIHGEQTGKDRGFGTVHGHQPGRPPSEIAGNPMPDIPNQNLGPEHSNGMSM
jgi:hypothetical protein